MHLCDVAAHPSVIAKVIGEYIWLQHWGVRAIACCPGFMGYIAMGNGLTVSHVAVRMRRAVGFGVG